MQITIVSHSQKQSIFSNASDPFYKEARRVQPSHKPASNQDLQRTDLRYARIFEVLPNQGSTHDRQSLRAHTMGD